MKSRLRTLFKAAMYGAPTAAMVVGGAYLYLDYQKNNEQSAPSFTITEAEPASPVAANPSKPVKVSDSGAIFDPGIIPETILFAFSLTCAELDGNIKNTCEKALWVSERTQTHPYITMAKIAMETGFRDIPTSKQEAQGIMQMQPAYLLTALRRHGDSMITFISDNQTSFPDAERYIQAIETLQTDGSLNDANGMKNRADTIHAQFKNGDFTNNTDKTLHDIRMNDRLAIALSVFVAKAERPDITLDQYTGDWGADYKKLLEQGSDIYLSHNAGANGANYIEALTSCDFDRFDENGLTFADWGTESALRTIQHDFDYPTLSYETLSRNIANNPRVFPDGLNTEISTVKANLISEFQASLGDFDKTIQHMMNLMPSPDSVEIARVNPTHVAQQSCSNPFTVFVSKRPMARPDNVSAEPVTAQKNESTAVTSSKRPRARPTSFELAQN